jgi:hypothetical protein
VRGFFYVINTSYKDSQDISQEIILAKRTNYQGEKRSKELNRLKKQNEKKERKKNIENDQPDDMPQTENELPPVEIV